MGYTCNHVFIDLQFSFLFPYLYFASHDFSLSTPFDVLPLCYFHSYITMMQCKKRKEFFDVVIQLELHLRRQEKDSRNLLTKTRSKGGGGQKLNLTRSKNQLNKNFHTIHLNKNFVRFS